MRTYLQALVEEADFQRWVRTIRERYSIPEGWSYDMVCDAALNQKTCDHVGCNIENNRRFMKEIEEYAQSLGLKFLWYEVIKDYVLLDELLIHDYIAEIELVDVPREFIIDEEPDDSEVWKDGVKMQRQFEKDRAEMLPIAIQFTPYATQRDLIDYIKLAYKTDIEPLQKKYRRDDVLIGRKRRRDGRILERNRFIYENRHLPAKELMTLVAEKFGKVLDYTYIRTIIDIEDKKRK